MQELHSKTLGARLRSQRERQGLSLADVADQTKIRLSLLQGLEQDDVSRWPSGIFRRSYIRSYAQAIGLDPGPVVREFLAQYSDPGEPDADVRAAAEQRWQHKRTAPPTRLRFLLESAVGTLPTLRAGSERAREEAAPAATAPAAAPEPSQRAAQHAPSDVQPRLAVFADACTNLSRVSDARELAPILARAAEALGATGLVVWAVDASGQQLMPVAVHGYADDVRARLPHVAVDMNIPLADAFRTGHHCVVPGAPATTGAIVVPLHSPKGCGGVLTLEFRDGSEQRELVLALSRILGVQLAMLQPRVSFRPKVRRAASASA